MTPPTAPTVFASNPPRPSRWDPDRWEASRVTQGHPGDGEGPCLSQNT